MRMSRAPESLYQPVWVKGKVNSYYKFQRESEDRYVPIHELASKFKRRFSVLDIGSNYGYFDIRLMETFDCVCVLLDDKIVEPILKENLMLDRSVVVRRKVHPKELEALARSEHFDIVLCLSVLHHFEDYERVYRAARQLGWWTIFEIPGADDIGA